MRPNIGQVFFGCFWRRMPLTSTFQGVVTALLAGIAFSLLQSPPQQLLEADDSVPFAYCIITAGSLFCNIANVTFSTLLITTVNLLVEERNISLWFVEKYVNFITSLNFMFFNLSIGLLLILILMFSFYTYSFIAGYVLVALCCAGVLLISCVWFWVDYDRWFKLRDLVLEKGHVEASDVHVESNHMK
ncbi:hypothetical protein DUNSADRAFT_18609 [Dunaliella salina]|uniref:PGG domain-containing protein n=1 Tax=Dunaliella salina TaxID=3046 RepID=A0ABQ7FZT8_DUNSA|nr:hypothetical protein DUNSADRAFT_18609 [Dunaliella salina]|eukprot:KAF5827864.1 hypothetical protein DUNSADRAFT_18609 [Dunaliella salina]